MRIGLGFRLSGLEFTKYSKRESSGWKPPYGICIAAMETFDSPAVPL
jgi:hypothetical protein